MADPTVSVREDRLHEPRTAAWLGLSLAVTFSVCFVTGLLSHLIQNPPDWFVWPPRPAGLYRITQGLHVVTGFAAIPLVLAKLWVVHPKLFVWPPVRSLAHGLERLALVPLVGGALFLLVSGTLNVARWYPWSFFFPRTHYWAAWITLGALIVHSGAKASISRAALARNRRPTTPPPPRGVPAASRLTLPSTDAEAARATSGQRRAFLGTVAATSGLLALSHAGGTVGWLSPLSALAQRRPGQGPQGVPINKSAAGAGVTELARDPGYRLVVEGAVDRRLTMSIDDLRGLPQHQAELPIACVEGWSASAHWRGVRLRDLLGRCGAAEDAEVLVESLQPSGLYRTSVVNRRQARDRDTLLALELNGGPLHLDHGYPVRLIGPNRPGVQQTKWVHRLEVR